MPGDELSADAEEKLRLFYVEAGFKPKDGKRLTQLEIDHACRLLLRMFEAMVAWKLYVPKDERH